MGLSLAVNLILANVKMELSETPVGSDYKSSIDTWQLILIRVFQKLRHDPFEKPHGNASASRISESVKEGESAQTSETVAFNNSEILTINSHLPNKLIFMHIFASILVVTIFMILSITVWYEQQNSQLSSSGGKIFVCALAILIAILLVIMQIALRKHKDSLGIKLELLCFTSTFLPAIVSFLVVEFSSDPGIHEFEVDYGSKFILMIQAFCTFFSTNAFLLFYSIFESSRKSKQALSDANAKNAVQKTGMDDLIEIILNPTCFAKLKVHLQEDLCPENGFFLEDLLQGYVKFPRLLILGKNDPIDVSKRMSKNGQITILKGAKMQKVKNYTETDHVKYLYNSYIKEDSPNELNIPSKLRREIKQTLDTQNELNIHIFDAVRDEVIKMVYLNNYARFRNSKRYSLA